MTDPSLPADTPLNGGGYAGQPVIEVERDGVHYTLLGTAHVSKASIDAVNAAIDSGRFDAVAVELDEQRHKALTNPDALAQLDLVKVIREKKVAPFAANLALAGTDAPEIVVAEVDMRRSEHVRRIWPFLRDRRIDAYGELTKRYRD